MACFIKCFLLLFCVGVSQSTETVTDQTTEEGQVKMTNYVRAILEHYKQKDPVGLPGIPIPDPMDIPPVTQSFSLGKITMKNVKMRGLKEFRILQVQVDLAQMKSEVEVSIEKLEVYGNYTLRALFSSSAGPFTTKLKGVTGKAITRLEVEREGYLEAQEINTDMAFKSIDMNFQNLGMLSSVFQNVISSLGSFVFDSIKPFVLKIGNEYIRQFINNNTRQLPQRFPNSIPPFDQLISMARQMVRKQGLDPYQIKNYNHTVGLFTIEMTHTWINGLSSFHRVGDVKFFLVNNAFRGDIAVGTQKLEGTSNWEVAIVGGILSRTGTVKFSVEYFKVQFLIEQNIDTRQRPKLEDIQLELGNIQVRFDGAGTADYIIELAVNVLPNLLRYQIMDALETPIKRRIQEELNFINVEEMILENVEKYDEGDLDFTIPIKI